MSKESEQDSLEDQLARIAALEARNEVQIESLICVNKINGTRLQKKKM